MNILGDYLDALAPRASARRGFGALSAPSIGTPGIYDPEMWTLDTRWAPARATLSGGQPTMPLAALTKSATRAMWASYVKCVRVAEIGGGWITQDWTITGRDLCTNAAGVKQTPQCTWGLWRLPICDAPSIALAWQGTRYLWAQQKMRELLRETPTVESAPQWVWSAEQLISVLLWSTNVRFGNPQSRMFDYARELERAGCIFGSVGSNTARTSGQIVARSGGLLGTAIWNRVSEADDNPVRPQRGPGLYPPLVPIERGDFSPWFELEETRALGAEANWPSPVRAVIAQQRALAGSRVGWSRALSLRGPDAAAPMPTFVTWMRETWGLDRVLIPMPSPSPGRAPYNVELPSASQIIDGVRRALEHYVGVPYLLWQTTILDVYAVEMQPFAAHLPGAQQLAFQRSIADFRGRAAAAQAGEWNRGEVATYTTTALTLIASLVNSGAGALLGLLFELQGKLVQFLGDQGLLASGFSTCPAFPFIRVPDPPCDALAAPVDAVGLPISPPTGSGPIMLTPAQAATLRARSAAGLLTPEQQAMLTRPILIQSPPAKSSGGGLLLLGAAALALLLRGK